MKLRKIEAHEYVLTKEEMSMVSEICAMCVNRDIHSLGDNKGYYDNIKRKAEFLYGEINNKMRLDHTTDKGGESKWQNAIFVHNLTKMESVAGNYNLPEKFIAKKP